MSKIGVRRYNKLLTVYYKINSLKDDFEGDRDLILSPDKVSVRFELECISLALKRIISEC